MSDDRPKPSGSRPTPADPTVTGAASTGSTPTGPKSTGTEPKLDLSLTQVLGGALAAMTAAALGSRLGVAGTITGAAVASVIAGVAGSLYTASLRHTRDKVATALTTRRGDGAASSAPQPSGSVPVASGPRRRSLPWKGVLAAAVATFAVALVALTGLESLAGGALSGGRGTTIEQVTKPGAAKHRSDDDSPGEQKATPSKSASPTATESDSTPAASTRPTTPTDKATASKTEVPAPTAEQQPKSSKPAAPTQEPSRTNAG